MRMRASLLTLVISLVLLFGAAGLNPGVRPAGATYRAANGRIATGAWRSGQQQIVVMDPTGGSELQLTNSAYPDRNQYPSWSPDGTRIAFTAFRNGTDNTYVNIYVMNADGTGLIRLTTDAGNDIEPAWSPDGTQIAFASDRDHKFLPFHGEIYTMNPDGSNPVRLTNTPTAGNFRPGWSPDGTKITFTSDRPDHSLDQQWVMNADGSNPINLSNGH